MSPYRLRILPLFRHRPGAVTEGHPHKKVNGNRDEAVVQTSSSFRVGRDAADGPRRTPDHAEGWRRVRQCLRILPRSRHRPVAVTEGSRNRKVNKTGVRLWTGCPFVTTPVEESVLSWTCQPTTFGPGWFKKSNAGRR